MMTVCGHANSSWGMPAGACSHSWLQQQQQQQQQNKKKQEKK